MSRGPGRLERAIRALFDAHPDEAFVTDELCEHCYPEARPIEKKHRVAVLRAARNVLKADLNWTIRSDHHQGDRWLFYNRDSAMSRAIATGIARHHNYRSEKRAQRKRYDWAWKRVGPGFAALGFARPRLRLPHGTLVNQWRAKRGAPPIDYAKLDGVWQREDVLVWLEDDEYGRKARNDAEGDVAWHRALRDADEATRMALLDGELAIMRQGMSVFVAWLRTRHLWATQPAAWLKRYQAGAGSGKATHIEAESIIQPTGLSRLADKARALMVENDPDAIRAGLAQIAEALDSEAQP
jgi:hypothetical protein